MSRRGGVAGRLSVRAVAVGLAAAVAIACGGDDSTDDRPRPLVGEVRPAIDELERTLDGPQEYFEVNADHRLVNLFVATDDGTTVTPYLYLDGEIQPPAPSRPVDEGATFEADDVDFDADVVLDRVADELPGSDLATFVVVVGPGGAVRYEVLTRSPQGGSLAVEVTADGRVLGVESM